MQKRVKRVSGCYLRPLLWVLCDECSYHVWCVRLCVDYTLALIASVGSGLGYMAGALWLRCGYNQYFYDLRDVSQEQFDKAIVFTAVGVGVELVLFFATEKFMLHASQKIDMRRHWKGLIQNRTGYLWFFVFLLQHVQTDVMIAKLVNV